jgi:type I restriction enzyme R subunit
VRDDYGKLWFNIVDYTGSATRMFADREFDGDPALITETPLAPKQDTTELHDGLDEWGAAPESEPDPGLLEPPPDEPRKFYYDGGRVEIAAHLVYELDADGRQLRVVRYTEYAADKVRSLCPTAPELRAKWANPDERAGIIQALAERGIAFEELADAAGQPEADPFDLLCHLAFNAPLRTRRERAQRLKLDCGDFFDRYAPEARAVLEELLEKYAEHGDAQFVLPDVLKVPPISAHGQIGDIVNLFGGPDRLRSAVSELQNLLYAA